MAQVIQKNAREELRLEFSEFKGRRYLNLRIWYEDEGEMRPGRDGFTIPPEKINELIEKLSALRNEGLAAGLLPPTLGDL